MPSVITVSVVMVSNIMLSVFVSSVIIQHIMLNLMAPTKLRRPLDGNTYTGNKLLCFVAILLKS